MVKKNESDWVTASRAANKAHFSELDVLLKSLDRFFDIDNLCISKDSLAGKNFRNELATARDVILRILSILEVVIPEGKKNAYWFQKFTETKFLNSSKRDFFKVEMQKQDTPEKSLYLLYDSFINLKGVVTDLLRNDNISYMGFASMGDIISKHIRDNEFFSPFKKYINPEFDVIDNHRVKEIVNNIKEKDIRKTASIIFLELFKFLRCLRHVDIATPRYVALHSSLLIIMLLRSEIELFRNYAEKAGAKIKRPELRGLLQALSYQFSMETKRVYSQELKDIMEKKAPQQLRGKIENSHGILKNLTEQAIIQAVQFFSPATKGEDIFDSFVTKLEQSLRLREDIYTFHRLLTLFEKGFQNAKERKRLFQSLKNFMAYFESFTFKLLRHDDYEEFKSFFEEIAKSRLEDMTADYDDKFIERCRHFIIFLETTLRHIANRAELADRPIDIKRVEMLIREYLQD